MKTTNTNATPSRSGTHGPFPPVTYRPVVVRAGVPVRVWVAARFAAAAILAVAGALVLSYGSVRWVGLVLVAGAAVSFSLGYLALAGARSASSRI